MLTLTTLALALALNADPQVGAPPPKPWTGSVGLGVVAVTGNARSLTLSGAVAAEHKGEQWIFGGKAAGTYGESRSAGAADTQISAESASVFLRGDYRIGPRLSAYVLGGVETDHPKSIEVRHSQETGAGYAWVDRNAGEGKLFLRTDLGFRVREEYRFQYFPVPARVEPRSEVMEALRLGAAFRWQVEKAVLVTEDVELLPDVRDSRVLANSIAKLNARLFGPVSFGVSYAVAYDSAPAPTRIPWDTTLAVTLEYVL
jgi:putative salt-induced outer membrane protein YdiY